jgi:hypothetical protein
LLIRPKAFAYRNLIERQESMTNHENMPERTSPQTTPTQTNETGESGTSAAIMEAFATARRVLPRAALAEAAARWPEVAAPMLTMLQDVAAGAELSERTESILFFALFVMAQVREKRAFRPLCQLAAKADLLEQLLGDGVFENFSCMLARVFDGNLGPLQWLIEAETASEYTRDAACYALAWLTADGQISRDQTSEYLERLFTELQPQTGNMVWVGWAGAISTLGLGHLAPLVKQAFDRGLIDHSIMGFNDFQIDLGEAERTKDPVAFVEHHHMRNMQAHDDAVALLSTWAAFETEEQRRAKESRYWRPVAARRPSSPKVGRNAPCPCGSGKKYKKCCGQ